MRIPLTKYGLPQVLVCPLVLSLGIILALFVWTPSLLFYLIGGLLGLLLLFSLAFFRDPERTIAVDKRVLLSPADGKVTDIELLQNSPLGIPAHKVGIFLSVFNVHINRAPCSVKVTRIQYKIGEFRNAMSPESGKVNESNDVYMERTEEPVTNLLVRQITGAIARRIVCSIQVGGALQQGERYGMIKFGSRTELYVPTQPTISLEVKVGDRVKAGLTAIARYT